MHARNSNNHKYKRIYLLIVNQILEKKNKLIEMSLI